MSISSADDVEVVSGLSCGLPTLDDLLGPQAGLPIGRTIVISGPFSSGKTLLALKMIVAAQAAGKKCLFADAERSFHKGQAELLGVDLKKLKIAMAGYGEALLDEIENWMLDKRHEGGLVVLDSYSFLSPRAEVESDNERKGMMEKSRMIAQHLRKMINIVPDSKSIYIIIAHHYELTLPNGAKRFVLAGGDSMQKLMSVWLRLTNKAIIEKGKRIGDIVRIVQMKNKLGAAKESEIELRYLYSKGFEEIEEKKVGRPRKEEVV